MELITLANAELYDDSNFLQSEEATCYFNLLLSQCAWERRIGRFGYPVPRDESYYGDPGTHYAYSGRKYQPRPWLPELLSLKLLVEQATPLSAYTNSGLPNVGYNAVLCNLYRTGKDSADWHADDEPEMGPVIASLSLMSDPNASRLFRFRRREGPIALSQRPPHGSLLIMAGDTQKNYLHQAPKEPTVTALRINLTFRHITHK